MIVGIQHLCKKQHVALPKQFPKIFAYLKFQINYTFLLCETFERYLTEDFHCQGIADAEYDRTALNHIASILWHYGKTLEDSQPPSEVIDIPPQEHVLQVHCK